MLGPSVPLSIQTNRCCHALYSAELTRQVVRIAFNSITWFSREVDHGRADVPKARAHTFIFVVTPFVL